MVMLSPPFSEKDAMPFSNCTPYSSASAVVMVLSSSISIKLKTVSASSASSSPASSLVTTREPVAVCFSLTNAISAVAR